MCVSSVGGAFFRRDWQKDCSGILKKRVFVYMFTADFHKKNILYIHADTFLFVLATSWPFY